MYILKDFVVGARVEIHPALDWWMRGARYGTVEKVGRIKLHVKLDRAGVVRLYPTDIYQIVAS